MNEMEISGFWQDALIQAEIQSVVMLVDESQNAGARVQLQTSPSRSRFDLKGEVLAKTEKFSRRPSVGYAALSEVTLLSRVN